MKILVAVDGSKYSRMALEFIASRRTLIGSDPAIQLLHVRLPLPFNPARVVGTAIVRAHYAAEAEKNLKPARARLQKAGLSPAARYVVGRPAEKITTIADKASVDLLVLGSRGCAAIAGLLLGSVTTEVLARTKRAVLIICSKTEPPADSLRVGIAVDGSPYGPAAVKYVLRHPELFGAPSSISLINPVPTYDLVGIPTRAGFVAPEFTPKEVRARQDRAFERAIAPANELARVSRGATGRHARNRRAAAPGGAARCARAYSGVASVCTALASSCGREEERMTLRSYAGGRLVVLGSSATALEAARAMDSNHIGTVIVQDDGRVVGLVTDRDLAVRVVGAGGDATSTRLSDVLSRNVATLSPAASRSEAIRLMQKRNVRRIPLVDGERVVGIVTFDDLLLDEAAPIDELAAIVRGQLGRGGPAGRARRRSEARAEGTYWRLLNEMRANANLETTAEAEVAVEVALAGLLRRLTPDEAKDLLAQLPLLLRSRMPIADGPDKQITRESIEADLVRQLDVAPHRAAQILDAFGATLACNVSAGQMEDVRGQLPERMRSIFPA
jgi:CBS domain-containing protein/nucleotide-binding universal stress UspA family protein/uncharacterized protein (DUF2267 family)